MSITETGPVILRGTDSFRIASSRVGAEFEIRVALPIPSPWAPLPPRLPVVFVLDGDLFFGTVTETVRLQSLLFGELPPMVVVGIGYGTNDPRIQGETRNRDLTPTSDPTFEAQGRQIRPDRVPLLPEGQRQGGGDRFLDFLEHELRPVLASRYPIDPDASALFGSSLGGLLAAHALVTRPDRFDRYLILSPSLWWHDGVVLERARAIPASRARIWLGVGALEEGTGRPELDRYRMVSNVRTLADRLVGAGQLVVDVVPDASHTSVVPIGISRGLRALFGSRTTEPAPAARRSAPGP